MAETRFISDLFRRLAGSGLGSLGRGRANQDTVDMCHSLLGTRSEVSGLVLARHILDRLEQATQEDRHAAFARIAAEFGPDETRLQHALATYVPGDVTAARRLHFAAEPRTQELIRALNRVPGATARLVKLRAHLLRETRGNPELASLDQDFRHLFASWFSRGFLELRQIDWRTPANILENIITYEAVHEIRGWDDLRQRVGDPDRRLFAFFHPAMPDDPLIFVEVALTREIPGAIGAILDPTRKRIAPENARVAVFYSISNCHGGLRGISFGNFLIKQVVEELRRDQTQLDTFVTLSPVPGLRKWLEEQVNAEEPQLPARHVAALRDLAPDTAPDPAVLREITAFYLTRARRARGGALDPVAHFHLGNGAMLAHVHAGADESVRGIENSWGAMVNYLYDDARIEANHQAYLTNSEIALSSEMRSLSAQAAKR
ncbi:malonyl-CoA decarboxylase [Lutimaribacter sp. EGI FJ00015]|uniref:Malonyl-CoA decarboxylase n=1 Tax=Lutimaribacter degradans TaxID=2945989 RepID=A0ACC5ZU44_9RHOB|nr:malonyl-CoA decarboxylase [Lutimaribacter sp. EGI FJ00013]MCM2561859.1 malonyl-CoA decarboxylase [Lutimaribacter sp. EGI FJ00013]MCO0613109.1 malonyl-CoA decarboxylase [Lutimaribacter sp. EGI FJ00015]MCO0635691.1 malonyl-CoA decarboxylase [Lutimaribacter sp. EGI FJ00014]